MHIISSKAKIWFNQQNVTGNGIKINFGLGKEKLIFTKYRERERVI